MKPDDKPWRQEPYHRPKAEAMAKSVQRFFADNKQPNVRHTFKTKNSDIPGTFYIRSPHGDIFRVDIRMVNPLAYRD